MQAKLYEHQFGCPDYVAAAMAEPQPTPLLKAIRALGPARVRWNERALVIGGAVTWKNWV